MTTALVVLSSVLGLLLVAGLLRMQWKSASGTAYLREDLRRAMNASDFDKTEEIMLELVDRWHDGGHVQCASLPSFCGMSDEEYDHFTMHPRGRPIARPDHDDEPDVAAHAIRHTQECCRDLGEDEDLLRSAVRHLVMWSAFNHGLASHGNILSPSTAVVVWGDLGARYVRCALRVNDFVVSQTWSQGIDGQELVVGEQTPEQRFAWLRDGDRTVADEVP